MRGLPGTFSKAITFVEFEKSGNPQEKYRPGGGVLKSFIAEAMKSGTYISYIDQVVSETNLRLPELENEIAAYTRATCKLSLEHSNPDAYYAIRWLESLEDDN